MIFLSTFVLVGKGAYMTTITVEMVADIDNIDVYKVRGNEHYFKCPVCGKKALKCSYTPTKGKE